jgi:hypothetical protein
MAFKQYNLHFHSEDGSNRFYETSVFTTLWGVSSQIIILATVKTTNLKEKLQITEGILQVYKKLFRITKGFVLN